MELEIKTLESGDVQHIKAKIHPQTIDPTVFEIPKDYQISDFTKINQLTKRAKENAHKMKEMQNAAKMNRKH